MEFTVLHTFLHESFLFLIKIVCFPIFDTRANLKINIAVSFIAIIL